jgi:hypothetical protein
MAHRFDEDLPLNIIHFSSSDSSENLPVRNSRTPQWFNSGETALGV